MGGYGEHRHSLTHDLSIWNASSGQYTQRPSAAQRRERIEAGQSAYRLKRNKIERERQGVRERLTRVFFHAAPCFNLTCSKQRHKK